MNTDTIAVIGSGNMGASLIGGLVANHYPANNIWVSDPHQQKLDALQQQFHVNITHDNQIACKNADVIILAIKPQLLTQITTKLASQIQQKKSLVISVAAGITEQTIQHSLGGKAAIVRCMPNTPALIGCGATALFANTFVTARQRELAESILRAVGLIVWLEDEKQMDVVTALSGSGPAYFFLIMEILQQAAEKHGLPSEVARLLTLQTAVGAARMALESEETTSELRQRVTSPGGTTEQAMRVLEEKNLRALLSEALLAAKNRSEELAKTFGTTEKK